MTLSKTAGYQLGGILLFISIITSLSSDIVHLSGVYTGVLHVAVIVLGWEIVPKSLRKLSLLLVLSGMLMLYFAKAGLTEYLFSLSKNRSMISMLAGVGFLRLIPLPDTVKENPVGRKAMWQTIFGISWLGAFINMSSIVIFADRMSDKFYKLKTEQCLVLTRGFITAALWSPFFVAMAVAISQVKNASVWKLMVFGLPFSQAILVIAGLYTTYTMRSEIDSFEGYPFSVETLKGPIILIAIVFASHMIWPNVSVIAFVTVYAMIYALYQTIKEGIASKFIGYVINDLPKMAAEVCLFLAAGFFGAGISTMVNHGVLPAFPALSSFGTSVCVLTVVSVTSLLGVHPIVSISSVGAMIENSAVSPNLLAMSFLMGWVMVIINPISGIHLLVSARYGFDNKNVWKWNSILAGIYFVLCCLWLYVNKSFM